MIGNIFTQSQLTVSMHTRSYFNTVKEVHHYLGTFLELFSILFRPPLFQVSVFVILTSLIVESMCHLMPDNDSDSTVIHCIIGVHIEKWRLQDSCGEADLIGSRIVISINSLRCHQPFILIYRLTGFGNHFIVIPLTGTLDIRPIRIILNLQSRIIFPLVRITDLYMKSIQFLQCFHLSRFAHPFQRLDTFAQRSLQILH